MSGHNSTALVAAAGAAAIAVGMVIGATVTRDVPDGPLRSPIARIRAGLFSPGPAHTPVAAAGNEDASPRGATAMDTTRTADATAAAEAVLKAAAAAATAPASAAAAVPWSASEGDHEFRFSETTTLTSMAISELLLLDVPRLQTLLPSGDAAKPNARQPLGLPAGGAASGDGDGPRRMPYFNTVDDSGVIVADIVRNSKQAHVSRAYVRAGPRATTYFNPSNVRAAIVTCGGLCPGLNNVIRELVETLALTYGAEAVVGVRNGYWGFHTADADPSSVGHPNAPRGEPGLLTPENTAHIHNLGGTVLGSDRGGHDSDVILRFCEARRINQLYIIGGDGTHRGAHAVHLAALARKVPLAVCAIPKTIDNDVDIIDRSFGFDTAVAEAQHAIKSAKVEAQGALCGVGVVRVMGRYAGFIAAHATLASGDVDLCLIPEVPIVTEGPANMLAHLAATVRRKGHAVVVVAEGAGEDLLDAEIVAAGGKVETDAGGNRKLPAIGPWLTKRITEYLTGVGLKPSVKYIDPSYMIRSTPANAADAILCTLLAQNAVHGAMAGFTGFSVGLVNNRFAYLPIPAITANSPRRMNARGRTYERLLQLTRQPDPLAAEYAGHYAFAAPAKKADGSS